MTTEHDKIIALWENILSIQSIRTQPKFSVLDMEHLLTACKAQQKELEAAREVVKADRELVAAVENQERATLNPMMGDIVDAGMRVITATKASKQALAHLNEVTERK